MKSIKLMGVAVVAALAVMAFVGATSASASTFCTENASPCPLAKRITTLTAETTGGKAVLTAGTFKVECNSEATASGLTSLGAGAGATGSISALSFTAGTCTGSCTGATAVNVPYHAETTNAGAVTVKTGGTGNPGATLTNCLGLGVSCTFQTASAALTFDSGTPATLTANGIALTRTSGPCPASGTWTAAYHVINHTSVFLVAEP